MLYEDRDFFWNYWTLGSGVHVQIMQGCCIGAYITRWFAASIPPSSISSISPQVVPPHIPHLPFSLFFPPQLTPGCDAHLPESMCSHFSSPTYEWEYAVFHFLLLCQFAENDGFQIHSCPCKGHEIIFFYGCIVFHGVCVYIYIYATFSLSSLSFMGIWVCSKSLLL